MSGRLPDRIEPLVLAEAGRSFTGRIPLDRFQRIASQLLSTEGELVVEMEFGTDQAGIRYLAGHLRGTVQLRCQRCLTPMEMELENHFRLGLVHDEGQGQRLPPLYEPLVLASEPVAVAEIVEDEVILALPVAPMHVAPHPCAATADSKTGPAAEPASEQRENPFAVLAQLKRDS